jgi:hypothetical protein
MSLLLAAVAALSIQAAPEAEAAAALEAMHAAAARSDQAAWADRLEPGLVWVGNETSERWDREAFAVRAGSIRPEIRALSAM